MAIMNNYDKALEQKGGKEKCKMKRSSGYRMRLILIRFVVCGFLSMVSVCSAWEYVWTQKADMPTPRWNLATGVVDGKIYAMGGEPSEPYELPDLLATVEEYDPSTDTWTRKADMPTVTVPIDATVVDGKIYVIGGEGIGSRMIMYDPASDTWTQKADMPTRRFMHATCVVDGKIYAIGGSALWDYIGERTVEEYDPVTDTWARKADMPFGAWGLRTIVVNGKIYALGGRPNLQARPWVQEYDPATDMWTRKADMPIGTSSMAAMVLGNKIIVIGGWLISTQYPYTAIQMYDTETDIWTIEGEAPFRKACCSACVVNNRIYVIGGTDRHHPCPALSTVCELTISGAQPDFNGDGVIDSTDVCIMIEHWGTDYSLCDIAPPPFGDGIVDVEDLKVLAEHLFEEVNDPTLIAHWPLDEAQGSIAYNSAAHCDGTLAGDPVWQPDAGMIDGALDLDGINDYVVTDYVLDPMNGPFSTLAWMKGGAPGQVVISQQSNANWLAVDSEGNLMTELKGTGRSAGYLFSETVITDGQWHRIGLVWDGLNRTLYVDGIMVAEDIQHGLEGSQMGLHIGCGKDMEPGSFFSGLIDDVRIYNRAVNL